MHFYRDDWNVRQGGVVVAGPFNRISDAIFAANRMNRIGDVPYVPQFIARYDGQYAIHHGNGMMALKPTLHEAMQLCIEWKNRGLCTARDIDNLFRNRALAVEDEMTTCPTCGHAIGS